MILRHPVVGKYSLGQDRPLYIPRYLEAGVRRRGRQFPGELAGSSGGRWKVVFGLAGAEEDGKRERKEDETIHCLMILMVSPRSNTGAPMVKTGPLSPVAGSTPRSCRGRLKLIHCMRKGCLLQSENHSDLKGQDYLHSTLQRKSCSVYFRKE